MKNIQIIVIVVGLVTHRYQLWLNVVHQTKSLQRQFPVI
jgi:hypothetical protein